MRDFISCSGHHHSPTQMTKLPKMIKHKLGQMGCRMAETGIFSMETTGCRIPPSQGWKALGFSWGVGWAQGLGALSLFCALMSFPTAGGAICRGILSPRKDRSPFLLFFKILKHKFYFFYLSYWTILYYQVSPVLTQKNEETLGLLLDNIPTESINTLVREALPQDSDSQTVVSGPAARTR